MIQQISNSELELMKIIWANGNSVLYVQVMEALEAQGKVWNKNTVITLLSRLIDKGLLKIRKIGRRNEYIAIVSEEDYQASQTEVLLDKLYEGKAKGLIATLIEKDFLSPNDYEDLEKFWKGRKKEK